ncbi:hypothetical protein [Bacillus safensis]|uniref:hypothetical protein n=1 Tax=Bacillus safensis TaxID=561879 RepID=UPI002E222832|nr:hypothetical protein [Bacillus safensis]
MAKKKETLDELEKRLEEVKKKKHQLEKQREHDRITEERKSRAHRLIETGALAEKYFDLPTSLSLDERKELFKMFSDFIISNKPKKFKK